MTINDLIPGNIYSSLNNNGLYIFRSNGFNKYKSRITADNHYAEDGTFGSPISEKLRLPTEEEILRLESYEKLLTYEIY